MTSPLLKIWRALAFVFLFSPCLVSPAMADLQTESLINLDFTSPEISFAPVTPKTSTASHIEGQLPTGWKENSEWSQQIDVNYQNLVEEGQHYLAIKVSKIISGYSLIRFDLPDYGDDSLFRLTFKMRNPQKAPVEMGIRTIGSPWKFTWSQLPPADSSWKVYNYVFSLSHNTQPVGFYLAVKEVGEVDIAQLKLERISREKLIAELRAQYPDGGPKNVLRNSRLPLGLQSGWELGHGWPYSPNSVDRVKEPLVAPVADAVGVSGFPPLLIKAPEQVGIYSEPFDIPLPIQKYTASVFIKGKGRGQLSVLADRKVLAKKPFETSEEWSRLEVPFDPVLGAKYYSLYFESTGDVLVDAWQVGPGEKATPYESQLPLEVALACPVTETGEARIQFSGEPAQLNYCVSGNPAEKSKLRVKVVNLDGESVDLAPIPLKTTPLQRGTFKFNVFPKKPLGAFRIETWAEDGKGRRISAFQEIIVHRLHRPRYWGKDAPDSPFGIHVTSDTLHLKMAKAVGANWVRGLDAGGRWLDWHFMEESPGQWTFFDEPIQRYRDHHLKLMGVLATAPNWASYYTKRHDMYWDLFIQPKDLSQYGNYVRKVVEHYKGVIDTYDVWNEPWNCAWFANSFDDTKKGRAAYLSGDHPAADYVQLLKTAYDAAKETDPMVRIVGINTTTTEKNTKPYPDKCGAEWSKSTKELNADQYCDVLSYHQYEASMEGFPGDAVEKGFQVAMGPYLKGNSKPIWMTEGSPSMGSISAGFYNHTLPYQDAENTLDTGNRLCRYVMALLSTGVSKTFLFSMHSFWHFGYDKIEPWANFVSEDGSLHPSADAFSQFAWELEDTHFYKRISLGNNDYAYLFAGAARSVAVIAPHPGVTSLALPFHKSWTVTDLVGNPLRDLNISSSRLVYVETHDSIAELEQDVTKIGQR